MHSKLSSIGYLPQVRIAKRIDKKIRNLSSQEVDNAIGNDLLLLVLGFGELGFLRERDREDESEMRVN